jgi:hypothetical protein
MHYPFHDFIDTRINDLKLSRREFISRLGYKNISKGDRRLRALENGDLALADKLKQALAAALAVSVEDVEKAIHAGFAARWEEEDQRYRSVFRPHAVLQTELTIPSPIFIAGLIGAERNLFVPLPETLAADEYAHFVAASLPEGVPCYGAVTGYYVNYSPDYCVEFNREGEIKFEHSRAVRVGNSTSSVNGRPFSISNNDR